MNIKFILHFLLGIVQIWSSYFMHPFTHRTPLPLPTLSWSWICSVPSWSTTSPLQWPVSKAPSWRECWASFSPHCSKVRTYVCTYLLTAPHVVQCHISWSTSLCFSGWLNHDPKVLVCMYVFIPVCTIRLQYSSYLQGTYTNKQCTVKSTYTYIHSQCNANTFVSSLNELCRRQDP